MNTLLLQIALSAALLLGGFSAGWQTRGNHEKAIQYDQAVSYATEIKARQAEVDHSAQDFESARSRTEEAARKINGDLKNAKLELGHCVDGQQRLTAEFVRLYNAALQSAGDDPSQPVGARAGAGETDPEELAANSIENGARWKRCRAQLNALIEAVR